MSKEVKVNLGCGPDGVEGWINFDWGWLPLLSKMPFLRKVLVNFKVLSRSYERNWPEIKLADLRKGIPLKDETVDWIYSSNFLEHLEPDEAAGLLRESLRVLKKGGRLRLVLPDLGKLVESYLKDRNGLRFNREFFGFDKDLMGVKGKLVRGHAWMYDEKMAIEMMKKSGFKNIKIRKYCQSEMPDVKRLDLEIHKPLGLYLEAQKD